MVVIIDGNSFNDLNGFYDEVERKLTQGLDWKIGRNLDAYNDVLRGGFGRHHYEQALVIKWTHSEKSRAALGHEETIRYLHDILKKCHPSNIVSVRGEIEELTKGGGQTLFERIVEITKGHPHITLNLG